MLVRHISCGIGGDLRQTVTHFVLAMTCMAFNPLPADIMTTGGRVETFPEIHVFDWLLLRRDPSVTLPAFHPERHAVFKILAVGMQDHVAGVLQTLSAIRAPIISIRLLVVLWKPSESSRSSPRYWRTMP